MTNKKVKEIIKLSLYPHHGDKHDKLIDYLEIKRSELNYTNTITNCFYAEGYYILDIQDDGKIDLNTNLIQIRQHEIDNDVNYTGTEFYLDENYPYEKSLSVLEAIIRERKIGDILD